MAAKLKATKKWIGVPDFTMVYNNMRLDLKKFGTNSIRKESRVMNYQFDINFPSWIHGQIYSDILDDTTTVAGLSSVKYAFKHLKTVGLYSSAWTNFPTKYKSGSKETNEAHQSTNFTNEFLPVHSLSLVNYLRIKNVELIRDENSSYALMSS